MIFNFILYFIENIAACLIYLIPLKDKNNKWWRISYIFILYIICAYFNWEVASYRANFLYHSIYNILLFFIINILFFKLLTNMKNLSVIFFAIFSKMTHIFALSLNMIFWDLDRTTQLSPIYFIGYIITYFLFYLFFSRYLYRSGNIRINLQTTLFSLVLFLPLNTIQYIYFISYITKKKFEISYTGFHIYAMVTTFFFLLMFKLKYSEDSLNRELSLEKQLRKEQMDKFRISKENIDWLNVKYHDLKHQLNALENIDTIERKNYLGRISDSLGIYENSVRSGNEVLDTIIFEKRTLCLQKNITWNCVLNENFNFIETLDLYTLLGNAISNSIEAVSEFEKPDNKVIIIKSFRHGNIIHIWISNRFKKDIKFKNELPISSKANSLDHGYGIKSIKSIVEKYSGKLIIRCEDNIFALDMIFPGQNKN